MSRSRCAVGRSIADGTDASTASGASVSARNVQHRVRIGGVTVEFGDQVDRKGGDADARVVDHRAQAAAEQVAGVGTGAPHVQRVGGGQSLIEQRADRGERVVGQVGELDAQVVGEVGDQRPFGAGIVHGRDRRRRGIALSPRTIRACR